MLIFPRFTSHTTGVYGHMEKVLIDAFVVPEGSKAAFLEQSRQAHRIVRPLPGFVEGFLYEQKGEGSRHNFVTLCYRDDYTWGIGQAEW